MTTGVDRTVGARRVVPSLERQRASIVAPLARASLALAAGRTPEPRITVEDEFVDRATPCADASVLVT